LNPGLVRHRNGVHEGDWSTSDLVFMIILFCMTVGCPSTTNYLHEGDTTVLFTLHNFSRYQYSTVQALSNCGVETRRMVSCSIAFLDLGLLVPSFFPAICRSSLNIQELLSSSASCWRLQEGWFPEK